MHEKDGFTGDENLTLTFFQVTESWLDRPHGVIHLLVDKADLLVA